MNLHVSEKALASNARSRQFHARIAAIHAYKKDGINPEPYWPGMWMWDLIEMKPKRARASIQRIISLVCKTYNFSEAEIRSNGRRADVVRARQIAYYLARECTQHSFPVLGRYFNRDHTTLLYGRDKVARLMKADLAMAAEVKGLMGKLS